MQNTEHILIRKDDHKTHGEIRFYSNAFDGNQLDSIIFLIFSNTLASGACI